MQEQTYDRNPEVEIERLRQEIQRRKYGSQTVAVASGTLTTTASGQSLQRAQCLLERAASKNEVGRRWPRWLRRVRRNQGAVNDSLAGAFQELLQNVEAMQRKISEIDSQVGEVRVREIRDRDQLAILERSLARLKGQIDAQRKELGEFSARLNARE